MRDDDFRNPFQPRPWPECQRRRALLHFGLGVAFALIAASAILSIAQRLS